MASHRFWRFANIRPYAETSLALTELQLLDGVTRVDVGAIVTSNIAPSSGALADLQDNNAVGVVSWQWSQGLTIDFDCGAAVEVNNFKMGAADVARFPRTLSLQWSDDGVVYTTMREGDHYVYPGAFSMTRDVVNPPRLRAYGPLISQQANATIAVSIPANAQIGDLLVLALAGLAGHSAPAGWTQIGSLVGPAGLALHASLWSKVAAQGDAGSVVNCSNVSNGQISVLTAGVRPPVVESHAGVADALNNPIKSVPMLTAAGNARYGVTTAIWSLAFTVGVTDMTIEAVPPWARQFSPQEQLRLGVANFGSMRNGDTTAGTWSTTATGANGGWAVTATIFAAPAASIEVTRFVARLPVGDVSRWLPPQPLPSQADMRVMRSIPASKLRRRFLESVRGNGNGRVKGTTKDKGSPNVPVSERVVLFRQRDCMPLRELQSAAGTGAYSFDYVDETETFFVATFDHDGMHRAVIADGLTLANGGVELIA